MKIYATLDDSFEVLMLLLQPLSIQSLNTSCSASQCIEDGMKVDWDFGLVLLASQVYCASTGMLTF